MRVRLFSMLIMFAILFGGLTAPETAHAETLLAGHGIEGLTIHDHADSGNQQGPEQNDSSSCHALIHHHCGLALATDLASNSLASGNGKAVVMPLIVQPMSSLAFAPPTEPPAA